MPKPEPKPSGLSLAPEEPHPYQNAGRSTHVPASAPIGVDDLKPFATRMSAALQDRLRIYAVTHHATVQELTTTAVTEWLATHE